MLPTAIYSDSNIVTIQKKRVIEVSPHPSNKVEPITIIPLMAEPNKMTLTYKFYMGSNIVQEHKCLLHFSLVSRGEHSKKCFVEHFSRMNV